METNKTVAVVGAGSVGATLAYTLLERGSARRVVLYDINAQKVHAEAMDIAHGIQFMAQADIDGSDDVEICRDAAIVVVTAGAKQKPGQSRLELADATISLTRSLLPELLAVAPDARYLMVTNPVDVVTYAALKISGLPDGQLFGSGTLLDSSRLRYLIARHCGVAVSSVHAYVVGEHGDSEVPLWSSASIGSVPLGQLAESGLPPVTAEVRERLAREVVESAYRIIEGKGATNYAIALAASRIVEAMAADHHRVLPVSSLLTGYQGLDDVCLSVPCVVEAGGVGARLEIDASDDERAALLRSAASVREVARGLGL